MVHGTCCSHHAVASCIVQSAQTGQSVFSKVFPKHFLPETVISNNGYPSNARPHGATPVVYVVCKKKKKTFVFTDENSSRLHGLKPPATHYPRFIAQ